MTFPDYNYISFYRALLQPFTNEAFGPELATLLLLLGLFTLIAFIISSAPRLLRLRSSLSAIIDGTSRVTESDKRVLFQENYATIDAKLLANRSIQDAWQEFRKTLIFSDDPHDRIIRATSRPQSFFNPRALRLQYEFFTSLPNFFVGLGLLGTFIGLIAALTFSTENLTKAADQEQIKQALNLLLTTAAAKFYISAAGLLASLILSMFIKVTLRYATGQIHNINGALEERLLLITEQSITEKQLLVQRSSLEELRLFNSNIAMKIGDAVRTAIQDGNNAVSTRLSEIANSFSKLVAESGTSAGNVLHDAMKNALDSGLTQAGESLKAVAVSLQELPTKLDAAAAQIQETASLAAKEQLRLTEGIQKGLEQVLSAAGANISDSLEEGTKGLLINLNETGSSFGTSALKIGEFVEAFASKGNEYIDSLSSLTSQSDKIKDNLSALCSDILGAAGGMKQASSSIADNLHVLARALDEFRRVANETSENARASQEAIKNTVESLQRQMSTHLERFNDVDGRLASVFNTISTQLELQSKQMSQRLTHMDQALAGAVNHFEQLIEELTAGTPHRVAAE
jgi:hypothetical protein